MRAIVVPHHGPPSVFEERELPDARLKPKDVRIRVAAAGVNFADLMGRVGLYPDAPPLPYAPGYEVAGVVEEAGSQADPSLAPGTRVMAVTRFWGYADLVRVPSHAATPIAEGISFVTAAAVPVNYLTAYLALVHCGAARPGERVLVHGGAGGVGLAVVDLARRLGVELYATAGGPEKCRRLEERGVVRAFDSRSGDYAALAREELRGRGFHLVLDPIGPESFQKGMRLLEPLGRIVCYGFSSLVTGPKRRLWHAVTSLLKAHKVNPITLMNENKGVFGLNLAHLFEERELQREGMRRLADQLARGELAPTIDRTLPLTAAGAAAAHDWLHERKNFGKVVLAREERRFPRRCRRRGARLSCASWTRSCSARCCCSPQRSWSSGPSFSSCGPSCCPSRGRSASWRSRTTSTGAWPRPGSGPASPRSR
jgi:NADPH:quinone reductase-like Zn-dependent oxidoreductase